MATSSPTGSSEASHRRWLRPVLLISLAGLVWADGPRPDNIARLGHQLTQEPRQAGLYLARAELHRLDRSWSLALGDLERARELSPALIVTDLYRAGVMLDQGNPIEAEKMLRGFLGSLSETPVNRPLRARAHRLLGRSLVASSRPGLAARHFGAAISLRANPAFDLFLEQAQALAAEGSIEVAIDHLRTLRERFGTRTKAEELVLALETGRGHLEGALASLSRLEAISSRDVPWLLRRGELLLAAGRFDEAEAAFERARLALASSLAPQRGRGETAAWNQRLRQGLEALASSRLT